MTGISKYFGSTAALADLDIEVRPGEIHALLGGNGSGKSTLIKILSGVQKAEPGGTIEVGGVSSASEDWSPELARAAGVRVVHQDLGVFLDLTVAENLSIGHGFPTRARTSIAWRRVNRTAAELIERFEINATPRTPLRGLSQSDRTLVAIARALQGDGESRGVLILDEPTASLPADEADRLLSTLTRYAAAGQGILYVTHRLQEVQRVTNSVTVLRDGHRLGSWPTRDLTTDRLVELIVGSPLTPAVAMPRAERNEVPVLSVRNVSAGPLREVDLDVFAGEVLGIAGLRGSGRTSLLRVLFGDADPGPGTITVRGDAVRLGSVRTAMSSGIAMVPENRAEEASFGDLSLLTNFTIPRLRDFWSYGWFRARRMRNGAHALFTRFAVKAQSIDAPLATLSGGNQQKVIVARWLASKPAVLLLDEPTQGVDIGARAEIYNLIKQTAAAGAAVVIVASDPEELAQGADRVVVVRGGRHAGELSGASLTPETIAREIQEEGHDPR